MINEETITLVNEQFNDALRMTKEMNHVCKSADNALFNMNTLRREFDEHRNIIKELVLKRAQNNVKLTEMKTLLAKFLEGPVEDRIHALAEEYNSTSGPKYSLLHASTYVDIEKEQAELKKEIDKYERVANGKAMLISDCHFAIKDLYMKFKNSMAEANRQKEAVKKEQAKKRITVFIDNSWPMSPRQIQQAIDTLTAFVKVQGEGDGPIEKGIEGLKALKKGVEQDIMDNTKCVQDGMYFKLKVVE
jgi:hypothetical protein